MNSTLQIIIYKNTCISQNNEVGKKINLFIKEIIFPRHVQIY